MFALHPAPFTPPPPPTHSPPPLASLRKINVFSLHFRSSGAYKRCHSGAGRHFLSPRFCVDDDGARMEKCREEGGEGRGWVGESGRREDSRSRSISEGVMTRESCRRLRACGRKGKSKNICHGGKKGASNNHWNILGCNSGGGRQSLYTWERRGGLRFSPRLP